MLDFRIAGALIINRYGKRLLSDASNPSLVAKRMFAARNSENKLQETVVNLGLHRKSQFKDISDSELDDFPILSLETLSSEITFGSFQLKFGPSYLNEFLKNKYSFRLFCGSNLSPFNF